MASLLRRRRDPQFVPSPAPALPATVLVRPDVLRVVDAACATAGDRETGGPLIGTIGRSWEPGGERLIVAILGTVPPGPAIQARATSVRLGAGEGERASSALRWWRSSTGLDLVHVGDWHRHVVGLPEPSGGDRQTAMRMLVESESLVWLTAVAVGELQRRHRVRADDHLARVTREYLLHSEVRFYRATRAGLRRMPVRVEGEAIPRLPSLPWHVSDPVRFAAECRLLRAAGYRVAIEQFGQNGHPGLALRVGRDEAAPLTVVTPAGYPSVPPTLYDRKGAILREPGPWSPARFLVDLIEEAR